MVSGYHLTRRLFTLLRRQQVVSGLTLVGRAWTNQLQKKPMLMAQIPNYHLYDSLALDALGNVCVATLVTGGITIHSADGKTVSFVEMPDVFTTNICFGARSKNCIYHPVDNRQACFLRMG